MRRRSAALVLAVLQTSCALKLVEMAPLKAAMLAKKWANEQTELDQKVGTTESGTVGVLRFGDDLRRRTEVAKAWDMFQKTSLALAASKGGSGATVCYAGLGTPNTLAMAKRAPDGWTLNFLLCNPSERDVDAIEKAEREMLAALVAEAGGPLTALGSVAPTLVCDLGEVLK